MAVIFRAEDHSYRSQDPLEDIKWLSVTSIISAFKQPFDADGMAMKSAKNKKSKWFGLTPAEIKAAWSAEAEKASTLGTFYHNQRESDLTEIDTLVRSGVSVPIFRPRMEGGEKIAPEQKLENGVYPEHFVYLKSAGVCGQSDLVEVVNKVVSITDYKTNKEIKMEGFKSWDGKAQMMTGPVAHLEDCHKNHYALQLSLYLYIILKHNPSYTPGKLCLHHVVFEEDGHDKYGNRIIRHDFNGNPSVKDIRVIDLPYFKKEVIDIINWLSKNRDKIKRKS
jgi:hypothetical protein